MSKLFRKNYDFFVKNDDHLPWDFGVYLSDFESISLEKPEIFFHIEILKYVQSVMRAIKTNNFYCEQKAWGKLFGCFLSALNQLGCIYSGDLSKAGKFSEIMVKHFWRLDRKLSQPAQQGMRVVDVEMIEIARPFGRVSG